MSKLYLLFGLLFFLPVVSAYSVNNSLARIVTYPDNVFVQYGGYVQFEDFSWFGNNPITRDVALCFGAPILAGSVLYSSSFNSSWIDVTGLFKYKHFNIVNGECYYVQDVTWFPNETKTIKLTYYPLDLSKPKWDTYVGNVSAGTIDLKLDPLFNSTHYEIGSNRSSNYNWLQSPTLTNGDVFNFSVGVNSSSIYGSQLFSNYSINNSPTIMKFPNELSSNPGIPTVISQEKYRVVLSDRLVLNSQSLRIWAFLLCGHNGGDSGQTIGVNYQKLSGGVQSAAGSQSISCGIGGSNNQQNTSLDTTTTFVTGDTLIVNWTCGVSCNSLTASQVNDIRVTGILNHPELSFLIFNNVSTYNFSSLSSKQINLSLPVSQFKINTSFSGSVLANVSFDGGTSYKQVNLSNVSWQTPSSAVGVNNRLLYNLYLLDNASTVYAFMLDFNSSVFQLNLSSFEKVSGNLLNYTYTLVSNSSTLSFVTDNRTESLLLAGDTYGLSVNVSGYFPCNYSIFLNESKVLSNCSFYNAVLNVSAVDNNNNPIQSFTVNISDNLNGWFDSNVTNNGLAQFFVLKNRNYTLRINNSAFGTGSPTVSGTYNIFTFINSILANIFDESNGLRILQNISYNIIDLSSLYTISGSTVGGFFNISSLSSDTYDIRLSGANYSLRHYFIGSGSSVNVLNAFLVPISSAQNVTISWFDPTGNPINGLVSYMYSFVNSSTVLVESGVSDIDGSNYFSYIPNNYYSFNCNSTVYVCSSFVLNPIKKSSYDVTLSFISDNVSYHNLNISASIVNTSSNIVLQYSSSESGLLYNMLVFKLFNGSEPVLLANVSSGNSVDSLSWAFAGYTGLVAVYGVANNSIFISSWVDLGSVDRLSNHFSLLDQAFLSGIIVLVFVLFMVRFGALATVVGGIIGMFVNFLLKINVAINLSVFVVACVIGIVIALAIRRR